MKTSTLHQVLQKKIGSVYGDSLPVMIKFQDRAGNLIEKELIDTTLDEIAFAMQLLQAEGSTIHARLGALERLYNMAREHRCLGSDTVNLIAAEVTK